MLILILDDSELMLSIFGMVCGQLGHETIPCISVDALKNAVKDKTPAVVLCDLNMPGVVDPVEEVRTHAPDAHIILISGTSQEELDQIAVSRGVAGAISKDGGLAGVASMLPTLLSSI